MRSLVIDNVPPINQNHVRVLANHDDVRYRQLHERTPCLQALLDPDHFGPTQKFFAKEPERRSTIAANDGGDAHYQHPFIASCFLLTVTGPSSPDDVRLQKRI